MSASESIATPTWPTSPAARSSSESRPICVGRSKAVGEAGLALGEQELEALVRRLGRAEAGVLADRPGAAAVHRRLDAARERVLAGEADVALVVEVLRRARACRGGPSAARRASRSSSRRSPDFSSALASGTLLPAAARVVEALPAPLPWSGSARRARLFRSRLPRCLSDQCAPCPGLLPKVTI